MKFICDFHVHSHFSRATSKELIPEYLDYWAALKGIKVIGTGDFTHPGWVKELKEKLEPAEPGLFKLKKEYKNIKSSSLPHTCESDVKFLLSAEISNIYKRDGKVRKIHNVVFAPDFETVEKIQNKLKKIGANIISDGRPILGLDSRDLLQMLLDVSPEIFFVPAHIWTPWFSVLGSKSGFNSIEECFRDLSDQIFAVETGLSTDPPMHWMCSFLDKYTLISNSDAHSPERLGRNANLFDMEQLSYKDIIKALKAGRGKHKEFLGTIDLFPQEGKYHYDGHRKCGICWDPVSTLKNREICPVCGNAITVGVMNRVMELSDREDLTERKNRKAFYSIIPLKEILSEITGSSPASKQVDNMYFSLLHKTGPELKILLDTTIEDIKKIGNKILSEAVERMRAREVIIKEGFDGEYGRITVFDKDEVKFFGEQESLFDGFIRKPVRQSRKMVNFDPAEYRELQEKKNMEVASSQTEAGRGAESNEQVVFFNTLNAEQRQAINHGSGPALVIAGPGTGKTKTLTDRIGSLIQNRGVRPENILAVTFTNEAAGEMKKRLKDLLRDEEVVSSVHVSTFHALGFLILKKYAQKAGRGRNFSIIDEDDKKMILLERLACKKRKLNNISHQLTSAKQNLKVRDEIDSEEIRNIFNKYEQLLREMNLFDLDDLIYHAVRLFSLHPEIVLYYQKLYQWILVDEYQDINFAQYRMIKKLMPHPASNLYVIGDPDQAIYGFRGADTKFINKFIEDYPEAAVYRFKKSYRCSEQILRASANVVNPQTGGKNILKGMQEGVKIKIVRNDTEKSEAEFVVRTIERMVGGVGFFSMDSNITTGETDTGIASLSDFAVLCRVGRQIEALKKAFKDHNIPYQTVKDTPFFKQEPVCFIIDLLKLSINPGNSFVRNRLRDKTVIGNLKNGRREELTAKKSVREKISAIINEYFTPKTEDEENLFRELFDLADNFSNDLEKFIQFADLAMGVDSYQPDVENVTLMTLHAAKGLEFKCVFIVGCEDGLLPYSLFDSQKSDSGEERRLLYVGMTRAERYLFLSHAEKRFIYNREYRLKKSPYLDEIEKELVELAHSGTKKPERKKDFQPNLFDL